MKKHIAALLAGTLVFPLAFIALPRHAMAADISLLQLVSLFISLGIIPADKADAARAAIASMHASDGRGSAACASLSHTLGRGASDAATGGDVSALQQLLAKTGDYTYGSITGYFGAATEAAVERYQVRLGIASSGTPASTGYGLVGPTTRGVMRCAAAPTQDGATGNAAPAAGEGPGVPGASAASATATTTMAAAAIDDSPLSVETGDLILTGSATGTAAVVPVIIPASYAGPTNWQTIGGVLSGQSYGQLDGTPIYAFTAPLIEGRWFTYFTGIAPGSYALLVYDGAAASRPLIATGTVTISDATATSASCTLDPSATTTSVGTHFTLAWTAAGMDAPVLYENDALTVSARDIAPEGTLLYEDAQPTVHVFGIGDGHSIYCHATVSTS